MTTTRGVTAASALAALFQERDEKAVANGYASLGSDGKVPAAQLPASSTSLAGYYFPESYGTVTNTRNGANDDMVAVRAAAAAANTAGGGIVKLAPLVYAGNTTAHPDNANWRLAVYSYSKVDIDGSGENQTVLFVNDNQTNGSGRNYVLGNRNINASTDQTIRVSNLTVDGNAAGQTIIMDGIKLYRVDDARYTNVTVQNVRGTSGSPPNESFGFDAVNCSRVRYISCNATSTTGANMSTGFSANYCIDVRWVDCNAYNIPIAMGFTIYSCDASVFVACTAFVISGANAFNVEYCRGVEYYGCQAGIDYIIGTVKSVIADSTAAGGQLGCVNGWVVLGSADVKINDPTVAAASTSCFFINASVASAPTGRTQGAVIINNPRMIAASGGTTNMVNFTSSAHKSVEIAGRVITSGTFTNNMNGDSTFTTTGPAGTNSGGIALRGGAFRNVADSANRTFPCATSTTVMVNDYPFPAIKVRINANGATISAISVTKNGAYPTLTTPTVNATTDPIDAGERQVIVPKGEGLAITYTVATPTLIAEPVF